MVTVIMKNKYKWLQRLILIITSLFVHSIYAIDNPDSPDLIGQFKEREKIFLSAIEKPTNGTRDTIRAYHEYKIFLDKELNKAYSLVMSLHQIPLLSAASKPLFTPPTTADSSSS